MRLCTESIRREKALVRPKEEPNKRKRRSVEEEYDEEERLREQRRRNEEASDDEVLSPEESLDILHGERLTVRKIVCNLMNNLVEEIFEKATDDIAAEPFATGGAGRRLAGACRRDHLSRAFPT